MGKVFSCLSCTKTDSCTVTATREEPGRPENKDDVEEICLIGGAIRDTAIRTPRVDLAGRSRDDVGWKLEDIESQQGNVKCTAQQSSSTAGLVNHTHVDAGFAAVTSSPLPRTDSRGSIRWTPVQDEPSPRKRTQAADVIPVSLRQARADYARRLSKQHSMTRALQEASRSPSPSPRYLLATKTRDIANSRGDMVKTKSESIAYTGRDKTDDKSKACNTPSAHFTDDVTAGDSLRQLQDEFFRAFPADNEELTPVPSFLKITGDGDVPVILKEANLKCLEDAFFQEFPVDNNDGGATAHDIETPDKEYTESEVEVSDGPKTDLKDIPHLELNNTRDNEEDSREDSETPDKENTESEVEVSDRSKTDLKDGVSDIPRLELNNTCDNDEGNEEDSDDDGSSLDDILEKLSTRFEHTIEEDREECENFCYSLILQCIDTIDFNTCVGQGTLHSATARSGTCITSCSNLNDTQGDIYQSHAFEPCIRRLNDDTDFIIAIDQDGICHPVLRGRYAMIAIDPDGVGHRLV